MNYRHAYHAGGFTDVLKHAVLTRLVLYLERKPAPIFVLDTHAGLGRYDLAGPEATRTHEADAGIHRLMARRDVPEFIVPYLDRVRNLQTPGEALQHYPGSPRLIRDLLRRGDRLFAVEKHPEDVLALRREFARDRQTRVFALDGYEALGSFVPPRERRGLVLIDPAYEAEDETERLCAALRTALRQWADGLYAVWYPIKEPAQVRALHAAVRDDPNVRRALVVDLELAKPDGETLVGCGLVIINPPYVLPEELDAFMPYLATILARERPARWQRRWLRQEQPPD